MKRTQELATNKEEFKDRGYSPLNIATVRPGHKEGLRKGLIKLLTAGEVHVVLTREKTDNFQGFKHFVIFVSHTKIH